MRLFRSEVLMAHRFRLVNLQFSLRTVIVVIVNLMQKSCDGSGCTRINVA